VTLKLWQLLVLTALFALLAGTLIGRYVFPHNGPETAFYQHLNAAYEARAAGRAAAVQQTSEESDAVTVQANVRAAIPALEAYNADHGGYTGATLAGLQRSYDAGVRDVTIVRADGATYCVESGSGSTEYHKDGPAAEILPGGCP
jgi:hypothetical protein